MQRSPLLICRIKARAAADHFAPHNCNSKLFTLYTPFSPTGDYRPICIYACTLLLFFSCCCCCCLGPLLRLKFTSFYELLLPFLCTFHFTFCVPPRNIYYAHLCCYFGCLLPIDLQNRNSFGGPDRQNPRWSIVVARQ